MSEPDPLRPPSSAGDSPSEGEEGEPFHLLFVCTGNTCRSPLAEVLARRALADRGWSHVEVRSAGVAALGGSPASTGSLQVAEEEGMSLEHHRATPLSGALVDWADLILTMSPGHLPPILGAGAGDRAAVITEFAQGEGDPLEESGVEDPVGGDLSRYRRTFRQLDQLVDRVLSRLEPLLDP